MIGNSWPKVKLSEVCDSIIDCVNKTAPVVGYVTPYKMIRTTNVKKGVVNLAGCRFVEKSTFEKWTRRAVPKVGDVILTREAPLGDVGMITTPNEHIFLGQRLMQYRVNPEKLNAHYLLYALQEPDLQGQLKSAGSGSTVEHIRVGDAENLQISLPPLAHQKSVGNLLRNYDKLIENNNRRVAILEDMAQSLYREWFVNFRYPNHQDNLDADGNPKLIDSPLGLIPVGWKIKCLKNIGFINTGKTPSKDKEENYSSNDVPFIKTPDMHGGMFVIKTREMLSTLGADSQKSKYIPSWAICVSCIGTAGIVALSSQKSQTNQQINTLVPEVKAHTEFMYFTLKSLKKTIENYGATGATMTNLSKGKFESLEIVFPEDSLLDEFHQLTNPMFKQIQILARKNENLKQQRDMLLPKLISGQIEL